MDWFLYDNGLRHERVKYGNNQNEIKCLQLTSYVPIKLSGTFLIRNPLLGLFHEAH